MSHCRPDLVRSVIRYSLKELQQNVLSADPEHPVGFPDSVLGSGVIRPRTPMPDDFEVYLMWTVTECVGFLVCWRRSTPTHTHTPIYILSPTQLTR